MPIRRVFIPWNQPALEAAATFVFERYREPGALDLAATIVALPGGRAKRRLLEILVERCEAAALNLTPPKLVTVGELPELLYEAKRPFASPISQEFAWVAALRRLAPSQLAPLLPHPPADGDVDRWLSLGKLLRQLHTELAASRLDFASVADLGRTLPSFDESDRWQALAAAQSEYLAILDQLGLWDEQTARLFAIKHREPRWSGEIVLIGAVDLDPAQRAILSQVAEQVTAIVFAPESLSARFDEFGCVQPDAWQEATIDLSLESITVGEGPNEQADAVAAALADGHGAYSADAITIGVPDESLVAPIERRLAERGVTARFGPGIRLSHSQPYRLLESAVEYLDSRRFSDLAALARHPAVDRWLRRQNVVGDYLTALDRYQEKRLLATIGPEFHKPRRGAPSATASTAPDQNDPSRLVRQLCQSVDDLLAPLAQQRGSLADWAEAVVEQLARAYGGRELSTEVEPERTLVLACQMLADQANELAQTAPTLAPPMNGVDAVRLLLDQAAQRRIPPPRLDGAVEMVGWLELLLDDAPALIITGFNEGIVPAARNADLFLPDQLRRALRVEDNERRYARDAYALAAIAASRESLKIIFGRRSRDNDPLLPSRLLFACADNELARRVKALFHANTAAPISEDRESETPSGQTVYRPPRPRPLSETVESLRVTEFRDYLDCPYRYYLRHRLGLAACHDQHVELDGGAFGSLMHDVLSAFGSGPAKDAASAEEIRAALDRELDRVARRVFGAGTLAAVAVQLEQLRLRLSAFAEKQAEWRQRGYRILHVELAFGHGEAKIVVDGNPIGITGRIDRIDYHEGERKYAVLDYKSADAALLPDEAHRNQHGDWIDLQLPLYRQLVTSLRLDGPVELGFVLLPKDLEKTGFVLANWNADALAAADEEIARVVRQIRGEVFWPPAGEPPSSAAEFASICQDDVYALMAAESSEAGDAEEDE